ncbi:2-(3-amino-3-carboxypropyl)histidine synthase subunit 2 [Eumeta japonica]|uniref:2-(3-amino-3-carboxypropyl)histidine synthase subunit 2 n=1 Tax=Eumeta variegata TaxID=151549 RepID=A0A4C1W0J2_EUMVA|nr:2-(3-amino-3-carboxypropyl)histidine synthase subunit 2 [Eumeta japonica]
MYPKALAATIQYEYTENRFLGRMLQNKNDEILPMDVIKDYVCIYLGTRGQTLFTYTISIPALKWYSLDPEIDTLLEMKETVWFKRRRYLIEKCKDANVIGILVCKLSGEQTKDIIKRLKELCKINDKKSYIISVGKPNVAKLANFPEIDIYVMIACPENDLYSSRDFYKPIVYPYELEVAFNKNRDEFIDIHVTDFDELLQGRRHYCELSENVSDSDVSLITGNIRQKNKKVCDSKDMSLAERQNWALENIGHNLSNRSWKGLEQKLGETDVKEVEEGRKGIPLEYKNEPK